MTEQKSARDLWDSLGSPRDERDKIIAGHQGDVQDLPGNIPPLPKTFEDFEKWNVGRTCGPAFENACAGNTPIVDPRYGIHTVNALDRIARELYEYASAPPDENRQPPDLNGLGPAHLNYITESVSALRYNDYNTALNLADGVAPPGYEQDAWDGLFYSDDKDHKKIVENEMRERVKAPVYEDLALKRDSQAISGMFEQEADLSLMMAAIEKQRTLLKNGNDARPGAVPDPQ